VFVCLSVCASVQVCVNACVSVYVYVCVFCCVYVCVYVGGWVFVCACVSKRAWVKLMLLLQLFYEENASESLNVIHRLPPKF